MSWQVMQFKEEYKEEYKYFGAKEFVLVKDCPGNDEQFGKYLGDNGATYSIAHDSLEPVPEIDLDSMYGEINKGRLMFENSCSIKLTHDKVWALGKGAAYHLCGVNAIPNLIAALLKIHEDYNE